MVDTVHTKKRQVKFNPTDVLYKENMTNCVRIQFGKKDIPFDIYFQSTLDKKRVIGTDNTLVFITYDYENGRYCGTLKPDTPEMALRHINYIENKMYTNYGDYYFVSPKGIQERSNMLDYIKYYRTTFKHNMCVE
jgi:hypothetical protein